MNAKGRTARFRSRTSSAALAVLAIAGGACNDPNVFLPVGQAGGPKGALDGTVTYAGPLPCTENGHVLGAAVLLVFDTRKLPPPDGLGTTAGSLAVLGGDQLFAGVIDRLTFTKGMRWCPDAKAPSVTVSGTWAAAPLDAGVYQVRGFYDYDGNFDPTFSISNLPTKGDIGGGAIDNAAEVLVGKPARFREIGLGVVQTDGTRVIPPEGSHIGGIAVTLALPLADERPVFYAKGVIDKTPVANMVATEVTMPSDFQLKLFSAASPIVTEASFIRITLGAGVPPDEVAVASASPFNLPVAAPTFHFTRQDVNGDGVIDAKDHVPDSAQVPSLFPLSIFTKLQETDTQKSLVQSDLVNQTAPIIVLQGLTLDQGLLNTATKLFSPTFSEQQTEVIVALRPSVLCLDPANDKAPGVLLVTHDTDMQNHPILADIPSVTAALSAQFKRPIDVKFGCLPEGRYAMNLVYGTSQAWTVPNEAGVCAAKETPGAGTCGTRARLASQDVVLTIGKPTDAAYCAAHATPKECLP